MSAVELVKDRETKQPATEATSAIVEQCKENGVLLATAGLDHNVIRFLNSPGNNGGGNYKRHLMFLKMSLLRFRGRDSA